MCNGNGNFVSGANRPGAEMATDNRSAIGDRSKASSRDAPKGQAQPSSVRYDTLDSWRGLACLLVIVFHLRPTPGTVAATTNLATTIGFGWLGVPLFFAISGYCISATAQGVTSGRFTLWQYAKRRLRRIYPPFLLLLIPTLVLKTSLGAPLDLFRVGVLARSVATPVTLTPWQFIGNCTLTESWRPLVVGGPRNYLLEHSWTLCYEEQFYFLVGLLCVSRCLFSGALVVSGMVLVLPFCLTGATTRLDGSFLDGRWLLFAAGMLVFWLLHRSRLKVGFRLVVAVVMLGAGALWIARAFTLEHRSLAYSVVMLFSGLLVFLYPWDRYVGSLRLLSPLRYCGQICYSLYLTHWFVAKGVNVAFFRYGFESNTFELWLKVLIGVAMSVLVGTAYFFAVERHFLNNSQCSPSSP